MGALGPGKTWFEIEGATKINLATAKYLHDRDVLFIDVGTDAEGTWKRIGRVPGAVNLPWIRPPDDPSKRRLRQTTLSEIVDKTDEVVFIGGYPEALVIQLST